MNNIERISSQWWSESIDTQNLNVEKLEGKSGESPPFPQYHNILIIVFVWLPDIHNTRSVLGAKCNNRVLGSGNTLGAKCNNSQCYKVLARLSR